MYGWGNMFGIGGLFSMLFMAAFWALIVVGIIYAVRAVSGGGPAIRQDNSDKALSILKERYAKGEIDTEEYESRKRTLAE